MAKAKVLIVEDEHIVAMDIQNKLQRNDYQLAAHTDRGEAAVKLSGDLLPDIILMDIRLKGEMDGIEAASQIRAKYAIPVIFLTAFADDNTLERARLSEPFGYLIKPFEERELIVAIEMALYKHLMEQKLRESESKFRSVVKNASDGIALINEQGNVIEWNIVMEQITELKHSDVIGQPIWEIIYQIMPFEQKTPERKETNAAQWKAELISGFTHKDDLTEREIESFNKIRRTIQTNGFVIETPQGRLGGVIMRDITDRKKMEISLRNSKDRLQTVMENASTILVELNKQGIILYMSRVLEGYKMEDVVGKHVSEWIVQEHRTVMEQALERLLNDGMPQSYEVSGAGMYGEMRWYLSTLTPVKVGDEIENIILVSTDITDRRMLEESERNQRQLAEALRDTAITLNSTLKLDDILDRILGNIGKLVPFDAAIVSLIKGDAIYKIRYFYNPKSVTNLLPITDMQANLINIPILKTIIKTKQIQLIPDIQKDQRWQVLSIPGVERIRSLTCAPIEVHENIVGMISLISSEPNFFNQTHIDRITAFSSQAAIAIENARLYEQAKQLSMTDPLTELFNMRYFHDFGRLELERCHRYSRKLSIAMVDIDHFKAVNDSHNHAMGDLVLCEIAAFLKKTVRAVDIVARYGGEEFAILMPETDLKEAQKVVERVRQSIEDYSIILTDKTINITISAGISETNNEKSDLDNLLHAADKALYKAKANGRNRVEVDMDGS